MLAAVIAAHSDLAVTVASATQEADGLRVMVDKQTEASEMGQGGGKTSTVRVSAADLDEPTRGAHLKVGGVQVYVFGCETTVGIRRIECGDTRPVEGV